MATKTTEAGERTIDYVSFNGFTIVSSIKGEGVTPEQQQESRQEKQIPNIQVNFSDKKDAARKFAEHPWLAGQLESLGQILANLPEIDLTTTNSVEKNLTDSVIKKL